MVSVDGRRYTIDTMKHIDKLLKGLGLSQKDLRGRTDYGVLRGAIIRREKGDVQEFSDYFGLAPCYVHRAAGRTITNVPYSYMVQNPRATPARLSLETAAQRKRSRKQKRGLWREDHFLVVNGVEIY